MNITELHPVLAALYNADVPGMLWGSPGIGKSTAFRAVATQLRDQIGLTGPVLEMHQIEDYVAKGGNIRETFGVFDVRLAQSDPVDIGGLPREDKKNGSMDRLPPSWFAHRGRTDLPDYGILLLDELPAAPLSVQTAAYQIVLDKVIGRHQLKDGWACFAAGNRLTDGGQYFKMPHALANRFCHLDAESNVDSWCQWAIDSGVDLSLIAFIRFQPDLLNESAKHIKDKREGFAFSTERVVERVDDLLKNNPGLSDAVISAIVGGLAGKGWAASYLGFRKVWHNMPSVAQILMNPDAALLPEDAATQYAVCTALAAQVDATNIDQALTYVERFKTKGRVEMTVLFVKDNQRRDSIAADKAQKEGTPYTRIATTPAMVRWLEANASLL